MNTTSLLDYIHVTFSDTTGNFTGYAVQNTSSGALSYSGMLWYEQRRTIKIVYGRLAEFPA